MWPSLGIYPREIKAQRHVSSVISRFIRVKIRNIPEAHKQESHRSYCAVSTQQIILSNKAIKLLTQHVQTSKRCLPTKSRDKRILHLYRTLGRTVSTTVTENMSVAPWGQVEEELTGTGK